MVRVRPDATGGQGHVGPVRLRGSGQFDRTCLGGPSGHQTPPDRDWDSPRNAWRRVPHAEHPRPFSMVAADGGIIGCCSGPATGELQRSGLDCCLPM